MSGDLSFVLFDRVRREAGDRLAAAVAELLPALARRLGRLAISAPDLAAECRLDDAARRLESEFDERIDRSLVAFDELHYRLLRYAPDARQSLVAAEASGGRNTRIPRAYDVPTDEERGEQTLAQSLAASARHQLASAYPTYLARLGLMLAQPVDDDSSALTAKGLALAVVAALRPLAADPLLHDTLSDSLRLIAATAVSKMIEAVDARMIEAGLLADAPPIVIGRSPTPAAGPNEQDTTATPAASTQEPAAPAANAPTYDSPLAEPRAERDGEFGVDAEGTRAVPLPIERPQSAATPIASGPMIAQTVHAMIGGARSARVLGVHPITGKRHRRSAFRQAELLPTVETIEHDAIAFAHQVGSTPFSAVARSRFFATLRDSMRGSKIDAAQLATVDLVQAMFDYVNDDSRIPEPAKPLLWRLQMPSVTLACLDPGYLAGDEHSMRSLVEHVAAISIAYPDEIVRDGQLYRRLQTLVRAAEVVAHAFQVRSRVLSERVAIEYSRATYGMGQLVSRVARVRRELEATAGQPNRRDYRSRPSREREAQVTQRLTTLMIARIEGRDVPDSVRDFLKDVWVRHLRSKVLRDGEDSAGFKVTLEVVDDLLWTLDGAGQRRSRRLLAERIPRILQTLTRGIGDIGGRPEEFGPFFDEMFLIHLRRMQRRKPRRSRPDRGVPVSGSAGTRRDGGVIDKPRPADDEPHSRRARSVDSFRWPTEVDPPTVAANDPDTAGAAVRGLHSGEDSIELGNVVDARPSRPFEDYSDDLPVLRDEVTGSDPIPRPAAEPIRPSAARAEVKLRRLIDATTLDDRPTTPARIKVSPEELAATLKPGDWLELVGGSRKVVLAKVAWINERRTVALLLQHPDRLILSRHLSAIADRVRRGRAFLVR